MDNITGRSPVVLVEIDQPICVNRFGVVPCTAALSSAVPNKCFNTRKTCKDTANYDAAVIPNTIRFCKNQEEVPREWNAIPCLISSTTNPTKLNPGGASRNSSPLGARATCTIKMRDFPSSDFKVDPYYDERRSGAAQFSGVGYDPMDQGTFWTKWLRRNPYYVNWPIRIREGYVGQDPSEMMTRNYIIEDISGPDSSGNVSIKAQDIFALADDDKAQCPVQSQGVLNMAMSAGATAIPIKGYVSGEYPTSGTVRIDDEIITYNGSSEALGVLTLTIVARGTDGTAAEAHDEDSRVQLCYRVADADDVYVWEVLQELLEDYAGVPTEYIPFADWQAQGLAWLPTMTVTTLITEPTGVKSLIEELSEQCLFDLWWDERAQELKFRPVHAPSDDPVEFNDRQHIIEKSWSQSSDMKTRITQVWIFYNPRNRILGVEESDNYQEVRIRIDPSLESTDLYGEARVKTIYSRWIENANQAIQLSARYLSRFQDGAKYLKIRCDAKDRDTWTGDVIAVTLHSMVDEVGNPEKRSFQVISAEEVSPGETVEYNCINYYFIAARYFYWMDVINCRDAAGQWQPRPGGTNEYSFDNSGGTLIAEPAGVYINEPTFMNSSTKGVIGSLAAGQWAWGDEHVLGYNTIYVRLADGTDPDTKASGYVTADYPLYDDLPDKENPPQGSWWSDDDGNMSDGSTGWSWQ